MPNPLLRFVAGPMNLSQGRNVDDPDSARPTGQVEPIPERYAGPVFPYRGQESHGVEPNAKNIGRPDEWEDERGVQVYDDPIETGPDPVPVRIVQDNDQLEVRRTRFSRAYAGLAGDNQKQIVGADWQDRRRTMVRVKNLDSATVYIGTDLNDTSTMSGWPLAQNEVYEHHTHSALYAIGTVATQQALAISTEYALPLSEVEGYHYGQPTRD